MNAPRVLYCDIETSPNLAHVWGLFNNNVSLSQLRESSRVICWAAKFRGEAKTYYSGEFDSTRGDMLQAIYELMAQADVVATYNGDRFDLPTLNREFIMQGWSPPAPYRSLDFYKVVRKNFRFASHKLDHVAKELGLPGKVKHEGHELWVKCMAGDPAAWARMERYCKRDTRLLEPLHTKLIPWLPAALNVRLYRDGECPKCGGGPLVKEGFAYTATGRYQRYRCQSKGCWSQATRRTDGTDIKGLA